jgi:hypothetical protein
VGARVQPDPPKRNRFGGSLHFNDNDVDFDGFDLNHHLKPVPLRYEPR